MKTKEGRRGRKEGEEEKSYPKLKKKKKIQRRQFVPNTVKGGWGEGEENKTKPKKNQVTFNQVSHL